MVKQPDKKKTEQIMKRKRKGEKRTKRYDGDYAPSGDGYGRSNFQFGYSMRGY